jgi:hypothetical protein
MAGAALARYFRFAERSTDLATEVRAGVTTFMVMAYIHWMVYLASAAFVVYFAVPVLHARLR